ncbi:unnamed protein product [Paramecium octaurelia]|uniref:Uncharacterized protein n=1 Tax=Paramecium octaurelia TaxID=43137 RepID=A0A8S1YK91_PAROT|nr:unnamed protein product [Paramecium octaurelia]
MQIDQLQSSHDNTVQYPPFLSLTEANEITNCTNQLQIIQVINFLGMLNNNSSLVAQNEGIISQTKRLLHDRYLQISNH